MAISLGGGMKILHLPGANVALMGGLIGFTFLFLPMVLVNHFRANLNLLLSDKLKWIIGMVSFMIITLGMVFKIQHMMGAGLLIGVGFLVFSFGFIPFFFFRMYKKSLETL
jgi:hypothetical protein